MSGRETRQLLVYSSVKIQNRIQDWARGSALMSILFALGLMVMMSVGCGPDEHAEARWEPLMADIREYFDSLASTFEQVSDEETASKYLPQLLAVLDTGPDLQRRVNEYRSGHEDPQLHEAHSEEITVAYNEFSGRLYDHTKTLRANGKVMSILKPFLDRINGNGNRRGEHLI